MRKSRFTEEQIIKILKAHAVPVGVQSVKLRFIRWVNMSAALYLRPKSKMSVIFCSSA